MAERLKRSLKLTLLGLALNTGLAAGKLTGGVLGHSNALIADGVESLADIFSSLIVWRGLVISAEPADEDHPYGHGKAEPLAAALVASMMMAAAVWIFYKAILDILDPDEGPAAFTLAVLVVIVLVKELWFRHVLQEALSVESSAILTDAWHHRSDAITSLAAAIGISVALLGGPRYAIADDLAAGLAAGIIAWNGWRLLKLAKNELMDMSPDHGIRVQIQNVARSTPGVEEVEKCLVRKMGYQYFVDMHLEVDPEMPVIRAHELAHKVKDRVREAIPAVSDVLVHVEPRRPRQ